MVTRIPFNGLFRLTQTFRNYRPDLYPVSPYEHKGVDMVGVNNGIIYGTMESGIVEYIGFENNGFGNYARIVDTKTGYKHYFAHMSEVYISVGQTITYTTQIGYQGQTGNVTGVHLHYEIRDTSISPYELIDPCAYMGIPNVVGTYNSSDYPIEEPAPKPEPKPEPEPSPEPSPEKEIISPWAEDSVRRMIETGIMTLSDGKFYPMEYLTREMAAVLSDRIINFIQYIKNDFSYAQKEIDLLIEKGILKGDGEGNFNLDFMIYKGEVAALLGRVVEIYDERINILERQISELMNR